MYTVKALCFKTNRRTGICCFIEFCFIALHKCCVCFTNWRQTSHQQSLRLTWWRWSGITPAVSPRCACTSFLCNICHLCDLQIGFLFPSIFHILQYKQIYTHTRILLFLSCMKDSILYLPLLFALNNACWRSLTDRMKLPSSFLLAVTCNCIVWLP